MMTPANTRRWGEEAVDKTKALLDSRAFLVRRVVAYRLSDQALDNLDAITQATGTTKTAAVEMALGLLANQLRGDTNCDMVYPPYMKKKTIDKNSAREAACDLFTGQRGQVKFYGDPETGKIEILLADMWPSEGYEYICTEPDGRIEYGQEICENDSEMSEAFDRWWGESGDEWVAELEDRWEDMP